MKNIPLLSALAICVAVVACPAPLMAQPAKAASCIRNDKPGPGEVHDRIRKSLVFLRATAIDKTTGAEHQTEATGFLVNTYGEILTVYHLYRKLGDFRAETLRVTASLKSKEGVRRTVVPLAVDFDEYRDLLKLRLLDIADVPTSEIEPVCFVSVGELEQRRQAKSLLGADLMTSGFPNNQPYIADGGRIAALEGATHHYWTVTSVGFVEGQSGSPIYFEDGRVFALVKGSDRDVQNHQYIIPIKLFGHIEPRLWEAQQEWELGRRVANRPGNTQPNKVLSPEEIQLCLSMGSQGSPGVLRAMLKSFDGTTAGECIKARLEEITASKPEIITSSSGKGLPTSRIVHPDQRARQLVEQIAQAVGLPVNFKVRLSDEFHNAWSTKDDKGEKIVLLSPAFLAELEKSSDSAALAVLAHVVGHIVSGHLDVPSASHAETMRRELEADYFSGFVQSKLGISLDDAKFFYRTLPEAQSETHPGRADRLAAVEKGWNSARQQVAPGRSR